jgi:hypothetical protein
MHIQSKYKVRTKDSSGDYYQEAQLFGPVDSLRTASLYFNRIMRQDTMYRLITSSSIKRCG